MLTGTPPQAYTRDTLAQAFEWLKSQPQPIKDLATSADVLVNLFLQSRKRRPLSTAEASLEDSAPVSSQSFKSDLRTLARDLKRFEEHTDISATPLPLPSQVAPPPTVDFGFPQSKASL